jgi:hypothetical protein
MPTLGPFWQLQMLPILILVVPSYLPDHQHHEGKTVLKKDNPLPSQWTIQKRQIWLDTHPISDRSDLTFFTCRNLARLDIVTKAVEQKKSKEQKLFTSNDGDNWYGNDPILCLIHTLDETEIRRLYMN